MEQQVINKLINKQRCSKCGNWFGYKDNGEPISAPTTISSLCGFPINFVCSKCLPPHLNKIVLGNLF